MGQGLRGDLPRWLLPTLRRPNMAPPSAYISGHPVRAKFTSQSAKALPRSTTLARTAALGAHARAGRRLRPCGRLGVLPRPWGPCRLSSRLPEDSKACTRSPCLGFPGGTLRREGTPWAPRTSPGERAWSRPNPLCRVPASARPRSGLPRCYTETQSVDSWCSCRTGDPQPASGSEGAPSPAA